MVAVLQNQATSEKRALSFEVHENVITSSPEIEKTEGNTRFYKNGTREILDPSKDSGYEYYATRVFPDTTKEIGLFYENTLELLNGYRIDLTGTIDFSEGDSLMTKGSLRLHEVGRELMLTKELETPDKREVRDERDGRLLKFLKEAVTPQNPHYITATKNLEMVLAHENFENSVDAFINWAFEEVNHTSEEAAREVEAAPIKKPRLFSWSIEDAVVVVTIAKERKKEIRHVVCPQGQESLLIKAAGIYDAPGSLNTLIELLPEAAKKEGAQILKAYARARSGARYQIAYKQEISQLAKKLEQPVPKDEE